MFIYDAYEELTNSEIGTESGLMNIELRKEKIATPKGLIVWDVFIIKPIVDAWRCPICYYSQPKGTEICVMCGYSISATSGGDGHQ